MVEEVSRRMAAGMASPGVEVKRGRGRPPKAAAGKGMVSPGISDTAPLTPDCIPKAHTITPPTPACVPASERVRPRRLFGAEEKRAESVTPIKSVRSTLKKSAAAPPREPERLTPKKAKAKDRGFEDDADHSAPEIRKSPRLTRSAQKRLSETPRRGRGRSRKILELGQEVQSQKVGRRGNRNATRKTGESLSEGQVRRYVKKIVFEGVEYQVGDDVYVRRGMKDNANNEANDNAEEWSDSDVEVEDCVPVVGVVKML